MNLKQVKQMALNFLSNENLEKCKLVSLDKSEESNAYTDVYLGEVDYVLDGEEVSSVFNVIVYKNGKVDFEWS